MDAAADAAGAAGDVDRVPRIAADHDDLVAAEERRDRPRLDDPPRLEVGDRVEGQRSRDPRDRVEIHRLDVPIAPDQLFDLFLGQLERDSGGRDRRGVWIRDAAAQERLSAFVELDRQILETHR